ncbi:MAG: polyribonucleotide nucleotidyltransferase [bacterium JZ-2024 1]
MQEVVVSKRINGDTLELSTGKLAPQANASVVVNYQGVCVLVAVTASAKDREDADFLPLLVDCEEKMYAAGRIPGGFFKREGRPSEKAILTARVIDRTIRPLFPKYLRRDVQVVVTILATDSRHSPDVAGLIGTAAALTISDIPFDGPVAGLRVGRVEGKLVLQPTFEDWDNGTLNLMVTRTRDKILMLEGEAREEPEDAILQAVDFAWEPLGQVLDLIEELRQKAGKEKFVVAPPSLPEEVRDTVNKIALPAIAEAFSGKDKMEMDRILTRMEDAIAEAFPEGSGVDLAVVRDHIESEKRKHLAHLVLDRNVRPDGRKPDEIRPLKAEVGILPRVHGSALFERGLTQVMTVVTLGAPGDEQIIEDLTPEEAKRYLHQYNFPGYSTGEVKPMRSPGRREIGHGALAERALAPLVPPKEKFPYTIRVVSEVLSSNGSTSMASTCGSSLALMDAGVPIPRHCAGISIGLVSRDDLNEYRVITDIAGVEDAVGDMDFKLAGTERGFTAIQVDVKLKGLRRDVVEAALDAAVKARRRILEVMNDTIPGPRPDLSASAPRIVTISISPDKIGALIGPGGKNIRAITEATKTKIDIEEDGTVFVTADDKHAMDRALEMIQKHTLGVEIGRVYKGVIKRLLSFGALVEILPGETGMVHISQMPFARDEDISRILRPGREVYVKVLDHDKETRKISLSMKGLDQPALKPWQRRLEREKGSE